MLVFGVFCLAGLLAPTADAQCPVFATGLLGCSPYVDYLGVTNNAVALAVADFNRDGKLDLLVAEQGAGGGNTALAVQLGNGDGTFKAPVFLGNNCCIDANWAAVGDFNGDGIPDIAASAGGGFVTIWLGDGTGNFTLKQQISIPGTCCGGPKAGAVGDFNGDGKLDLIVIDQNANPGVAEVFLGNGDGTFASPPAVVALGTAGQNSPDSVVVGDFNHDGHLDFATMNEGCCNDSISVVMGNGNGTFQAAVNYPVANANGNAVNGISIVTADFNHDTYLDLATLEPGTNGGLIAIFLNNGDGTFQAPSFYSAQGAVTDPSFAMDLAVADFNKDGNPDLVFSADWRGGAGVLLGNADGTFGQPIWVATDVDATGVATGDFNGDGNPDFVVSTSTNNTVTVVLGNGDGSFRSARNYVPFIVSSGNFPGTSLPNPTAVAFADFNGDGKPDMAEVDAVNSNVALFLNNGDGTFTELANYLAGGGQPPLMAVAADVNHDGKMDLVLSLNSTGTQSSFSVLLGNGDGSFQSPLVYSNGTGAGSDTIAVADVNGDGKLDVISDTQNTNANASFYVNLGNGDGTFQKPIATPALCPGGSNSGAVYLSVADVSGDGKPDIVAACNPGLHQTTISVLLGNGDGTFGSPSQFASGTTPVNPVIADFNEDGKPDVAVVDNSPTPQVSVMLGNGDGTFQSPASFSIFPNGGTGWGWPGGNAYPSPAVIAAADFNLDGHFDLLVGDIDAHQLTFDGGGSYNIGVQLFPGNGDGTFQPVQNYLAGRQGTYFAVADLDGNGSPDVGVVSSTDNSVNILLNQLSTPAFVPQSITVTPGTASIAAGLTQQFTATGHLSHGTTQDLTRLVTWSSSSPDVEITNEAWSQGLATGVSAGGPVTVTAKLNGVAGTAQLTVTPPALQSITVTPATVSVAAGLTRQFSAVGHFSDGSTQPLTASVSWSSSNTNIATISNSAGSHGLTTGVTAAASAVTITAMQSSISGTAQLTVTAPVLVSITISPVNPSVPIGGTQKFSAVGTYSDGSNQGITNSVTWASSNTGAATIAASGSASAKALGTTMISATQGTVSNSTIMTVAPTCDLNRDGAFDVGDVQLIINQALGTLAPVDDLNGDGKVNVVDIQIVINSVLFSICTL